MERANSIHPINPIEEKKLQQWFYISSLTLSATILILCITSGFFTFRYFMLQREHAALTASSAPQADDKKSQLQQKIMVLNKQLEEIEQFKSHGCKPLPFLSLLGNVITDEIHCSSIQLAKEKLSLEGYGTTAADVMNFIEKLEEEECIKTVQIHHLRADSMQGKACVHFSLNAHCS